MNKYASTDKKQMTVERLPIAELSPDPANARKHPERNLEAIKSSLRRFGQQKPIVIDSSNVVRAGNGTMAAAKALGWNEIDAVRSDLPLSELTAFAIADNRTAELAEWDEEILAGVLSDPDIGDVGFDEKEIAALDALINPVEVVEDEVPSDVPERCKAGDLWQLGEHRLLCGDSTKAEDVARLMGGERASCVFTDPPYGVSIAAKNRTLNSLPVGKGGGHNRNLTDIIDDDLSPEELEASLLEAFVHIRTLVMAEDCTLFVCSPQGCGLSMMMMMMMMQKAGLKARHVLIWIKNAPTFSMGRLDYDYQHEPILLTWTKRHKRPMNGTHKTSVWKVDKPRKSAEHPTMKPVELYVNAYMNNSDSGDIVADMYGGSGTAAIAAEQVGRKARLMELSSTYCDIILARWEKFTGKAAELIEHGRTPQK